MDHLYAIIRTDIIANAATITSIPVYNQFFIIYFPGAKVTDLCTFTAIGTFIRVGFFDKISLATFIFVRLQEVLATVVTAKAYTIRFGHILFVSERSSYQMPLLCFSKDFLFLSLGDLFDAGTASGNISPEHQTDIYA